ncbi:sigma-70 family RNA polymerase sigma factor [Roseateles sp.]|uniref:sigma-70 family RNA polymerase sigma factor n=1 Tax=Roseateles sp. TaxID=1971397 RepID=UPI0039ED4898
MEFPDHRAAPLAVPTLLPVEATTRLSGPQPSLQRTFIDGRRQLLWLARSIVHSPETAEDILQDAYVRLMDGSCPPEVRRPYAYCCQVVRNLAYDHCRQKMVEERYRVFTDGEELLDRPGGYRPDRALVERRAIKAIERLLQCFPARTRRAFELYRLGGATQRDIAAELDCSAATVNAMIKEVTTALSSCAHLVDGTD